MEINRFNNHIPRTTGSSVIRDKIEEEEINCDGDQVTITNPPYFYGGRDDPQMVGDRPRNVGDGKLRKKRDDTKVRNLVKKYPELLNHKNLYDEHTTLGDLEDTLGSVGIKETLIKLRETNPKIIFQEIL